MRQRCFLCGIESEWRWEGGRSYLVDWYNCENHCGRFGISVEVAMEMARDRSHQVKIREEKNKLANFAHLRRAKKKKPLLLYAKESEVFPEETQSSADLFKWDQLISLLDDNGEMTV